MKKKLQVTKIVAICMAFISVHIATYGQTVNSMAELMPYLDDDGVTVVMTPGTYSITAEDIDNGLYGTVNPLFADTTILLDFIGSNSTYDFTGVKLNIDTVVFTKFGSNHVNEIQVRGSNVLIKNLTMEDIGWTKPNKTALGIGVDGIGNTLEGIHLTVRGSFPYGYGDMFGKGSGSVIGHNKHAAILVRGENNTVKDCTIMHYAYGHGIFVQGGINTTVEGCYLEGELRTTDDVLAEAGTGSPADLVDFVTVYNADSANGIPGYKVPAGWMFSKQEDGIRAYNTGPHWLTGETTNTSNMSVIDCTVKRFRSGVVIGFANNTKYVENCTTIECETQYSMGRDATVINSRGDTKYGPLYVDEYDNSNSQNNTMNFTVLNNNGAYGNDMLAFIGGNDHDITFRNTVPFDDTQMDIVLSGVRRGLRFSSGSEASFSSSGVEIHNNTNNPIISGNQSSNNIIESCGIVKDTGTNNTINPITCDAGQTTTNVSVTWVSIAPYSLELNVEETQQLTTVVYPINATNTNVSYVIDDPSIASIDANGTVTALKLGSTFVNVISEDGNLIDTSYINVSYSTANNLALATNGGVATQSTTAYDGVASRANDGDINGNYGDESVSHTAHGLDGSNTLKWWQVDLGVNKTIWDIIIYNRTGGTYGDALNNFTVEVINDNNVVVFTKIFISPPSPTLIINAGNVVGKFVKISKTSDDGLQLAEVEVFGTSTLSVEDNIVSTIKIYPNPVKDSFSIADSADAVMEIYSMLGKLLMSQTIKSNQHVVDVSALTSGFYIVKIKKDNMVFTKKVIKE
ncbi:T9SS type A sorting domain-containing protein [Algibacter sp. L1A34]|uniref:T9SS type A sorting domain-containing protein n=1 Tax=Algibacter sp. L1A34 TaxID=2686365 RepID=UPI00131E0E63|nr:T9SS type A sorting domain-containing protein [Algibacter sp. L1A34]